jgi:putative FmdB family regulatory protein
MPVYEYECGACGHEFEEWQKITDKAVRTCPKCKAKKVERLISQTAFHLKGGGWYSDLYSKKKSAPTEGSGSGGGEKEKGESGKSGSADKAAEPGKPSKAPDSPKTPDSPSRAPDSPKKKDRGGKADAAA